jgi:DNA-binding beta-propeller fold protein YncE
MYAADTGGLTVTDVRTLEVIARPRSADARLRSPWTSPGLRRVYAPFQRDSTAMLAVYDVAADSFVAELVLGADRPTFSCEFASNLRGTRVYCSQYPSGGVTVIDSETDSVLGRIAGIALPTTLLVDEAAGFVYCKSDGNGSIAVIDTASLEVVRTLDPGRWTRGVTLVGPSTLYAVLDGIPTPIYSPATKEHGLVALDMNRCRVARVIDSTQTACRMTADPERGLVYCYGFEMPHSVRDTTVVVIDAKTNRVVRRHVIAAGATGVTIDPLSGCAYVGLGAKPGLMVLPASRRNRPR